jgi:hypothetical protein
MDNLDILFDEMGNMETTHQRLLAHLELNFCVLENVTRKQHLLVRCIEAKDEVVEHLTLENKRFHDNSFNTPRYSQHDDTMNDMEVDSSNIFARRDGGPCVGVPNQRGVHNEVVYDRPDEWRRAGGGIRQTHHGTHTGRSTNGCYE